MNQRGCRLLFIGRKKITIRLKDKNFSVNAVAFLKEKRTTLHRRKKVSLNCM